MQPLPTTTTTDPDLAELITRMDEAADAYMRGDIRRYLELIPNAPECSLMPPYGGGPLSTAEAILIAFLDDHSRAVVAARWGHAENAVALREALRIGLASRGRPDQC